MKQLFAAGEKEAYEADMQKVEQAILEGEIYAKIESVSRSGMSRCISFYMIDENIKDDPSTDEGYTRDTYIWRVTREVAWLTGWVPVGEHKSRGKWMVDAGLHVDGCGMDMIFHTLYSALPHEKVKMWNKRYNIL